MGILKKVGKFGGLGIISGLVGGKGKGVIGKIAGAGGFGLAGLALSGKDKKNPTPAGSAPAAIDGDDERAKFGAAWDDMAKKDAARAAPAIADTSDEDEAKRIKKLRARRLGGGNGLNAGREATPNYTKGF